MTNIVHVDDAQARITETIKVHPVVLFMKGNPSRPQCGFSATVVQTLAQYGVPVHAVDVLMALFLIGLAWPVVVIPIDRTYS
jgi:glutaredoxin-related protein